MLALPAVQLGNGDLWVFVRGTNNDLQYNRFTGGAWQGWGSVGSPPGGVTSDPTAMVRGGSVYAYVRSGNGTVYQWSSFGGWSAAAGVPF